MYDIHIYYTFAFSRYYYSRNIIIFILYFLTDVCACVMIDDFLTPALFALV